MDSRRVGRYLSGLMGVGCGHAEGHDGERDRC
jgi:hypothetical protein